MSQATEKMLALLEGGKPARRPRTVRGRVRLAPVPAVRLGRAVAKAVVAKPAATPVFGAASLPRRGTGRPQMGPVPAVQVLPWE